MSDTAWLAAEAEATAGRERIRTLEDALLPFADAGHTVDLDFRAATHDDVPDRCRQCYPKSWPCKYETARRALEGEG